MVLDAISFMICMKHERRQIQPYDDIPINERIKSPRNLPQGNIEFLHMQMIFIYSILIEIVLTVIIQHYHHPPRLHHILFLPIPTRQNFLFHSKN